MTCQQYEPLIALYVEGDLDDRDVEFHIAQCPGCRELLEDLRASQASLKEPAPVDAAFLAAVRSGVLDRTQSRRLPGWPLAVAFAMAVALMVTIPKPPPKPVRRADVAVQNPPPGRTVEVAQAAPRTKRIRPTHRPPSRRAPSTEPLVVKMLTGDPDIVIIWLVDRTGD